MNFPSIDIQGSIISSDLLGQIRTEQANFQQGKDFDKEYTNTKLKDEISSTWQDAKGQWIIFQNKLSRLTTGESGTTETRNFWIIPLLTNLGYNLSYNRQTEEFNGKSFSIGYKDTQLDGFPVYVGGFNDTLDKRPENKLLRVSPHAMVQEYLNYSENLYGLVTNGKQIRLLRDASRITRLSYVEFNLQKIMEEDLYSDFVIFYRLLHASRMPQKVDGGAESIIEKYHQEGLEAGSAIRSKLGNAVKNSIIALANGFLNHHDNLSLREAMLKGELKSDEYYRHLLRIIYRLLFLFVIEERNLVYAESKTSETKRFSHIYYNYYSLLRLRRLASKLPPPDAVRHFDLWQSLLSTFALYEKREIGEKMGIMALQGDLFDYSAISNPVYDLHQCRLSNSVLLGVLNALGYFKNDNDVLIAVNYGGLDVEEFGSVYEGLLELKLNITQIEGDQFFSCTFQKIAGGREFQSHYTPEELVQPLITHSLEYLILDRIQPYQQKKADKETTLRLLLSLKIGDIACGSGHILLSAARRLAFEVARVQTDEEQPNPMAIRKAIKQVVRQCIFGVDKNPLAVELCKVALWLESHNPGEPLNFLDHHIKCGDSIVGLARKSELDNGIANEAFKPLPGDEKDIAKTFRDNNIKERKDKEQSKINFEAGLSEELKAIVEKYNLFKDLPERTPEEVENKARSHRKYEEDYRRIRLKQLADAQVAQFFIQKTSKNKEFLLTDAEYREHLRQVNKHLGSLQSNKLSNAQIIADKNHRNFFHWFLEFPEVIEEGGFDCILGNPPFLGNRDLSNSFGDSFLNWVKFAYRPAGSVDLVTYFFRRIFEIIHDKGYQSLISTNTISQGAAREGGLQIILEKKGTIIFGLRTIKWPGIAKLSVSLISIFKGVWDKDVILDGKTVPSISSYLDDDIESTTKLLKCNNDLAFQGSVILGEGFILTPEQANRIIQTDYRNKDVLYPYLDGDDFNSSIDQKASRWVINFDERTLDEAKQYQIPFEIVYEKVRPERIDKDEKKYPRMVQEWWKFWMNRKNLSEAILNFNRVLVCARVSKHFVTGFVSTKQVFHEKLVVFAYDSWVKFAFLQSNIHSEWAWKYRTTLESRLSYTPSDIFQTFPFPIIILKEHEEKLEKLGEEYHEHRRQLMLRLKRGYTKTYNSFHANNVHLGITSLLLMKLEKKEIEKQYSKEVWNLWNHIQKKELNCSYEEAIKGIIRLRELQVQIDNVVLETYGWQDIMLRHDFYEIDYLPKDDRIRYTLHPDARKEILKRLLELNHQIHEEEVKAGLWDKRKPQKEKKQAKQQSQDLSAGLFGYGGLFDTIEK